MASEMIYDESEEIFQIEEKIITFKIKQDKNLNISSSKISEELNLISKSKIIIKNVLNEYIAFRVKTTKKKNYIVNPSYCIIKPNDSIEINIFYYIKEGEDIISNGHKFKFEGFVISEEEKEKSAKDLFYEKRNQKVKGTIIKKKVKFEFNQGDNKDQQLLNNHKKGEEDENKFYYQVNEDERKHVEELEDLKVEFFKLKYTIDNLKNKYYNLKERLEMEQRNNNFHTYDNVNFQILKEKINSMPVNTYIYCFILAIIVGFYLVK